MNEQTQRLSGKRALVTGSGTGIGRGIAWRFAREGAAVAIHYSHNGAGAIKLRDEIRAAGGKAEAFRADFTDTPAAQQLGAQAVAFLGGLDILINNAGITMNQPFEKVTPVQFDTLYGVNIKAQFFLTQQVLPALLQSRGTVVNITSIHAYEGMPQHAVYAGTKGAIVAYTRALAIELIQRGVRLNAIAPGAVFVENHKVAMPEATPEAAGKVIPAGFCGEVDDIAQAAIFLATEDSRYIVGQTLIVDGGTTSWMPFNDSFRQPLSGQFGRGYVPGI